MWLGPATERIGDVYLDYMMMGFHESHSRFLGKVAGSALSRLTFVEVIISQHGAGGAASVARQAAH